MKTAVFQIDEGNGAAYLVCVRMPSLHSACDLETWLRMQAGPKRHIKLLGRFDAVHAVSGQGDAEILILGGNGEAGEELIGPG